LQELFLPPDGFNHELAHPSAQPAAVRAAKSSGYGASTAAVPRAEINLRQGQNGGRAVHRELAAARRYRLPQEVERLGI